LIWSDFVELLISNDKIRYFVTFLCDFIKRSMIYMLRVKLNTFEIFKHFQQYNEHENNQIRLFCINWEKEYSSNEFDDYDFEHDIQWKLIKTINYLKNRFSMTNKTVIFYEINTKKNRFLLICVKSRWRVTSWNENQSRNKRNSHLNHFLSFL
jgi:hypothetical protein